ncbi:MAG: Ryanodine receptor Ryr [Tannerella sp.]|jgi:ryanodine receptor 2|nr:Ryanodine receptor Ryr [Tannerella sp.]
MHHTQNSLQPLDTSGVELPPGWLEIVEQIAVNVHETWVTRRIAEGWKYGIKRDDERKENPCLVPYCELPEDEKEYDRRTVIETLKTVVLLGKAVTTPTAVSKSDSAHC